MRNLSQDDHNTILRNLWKNHSQHKNIFILLQMSFHEESRKFTTLYRNVFFEDNEVFYQNYILLIEIFRSDMSIVITFLFKEVKYFMIELLIRLILFQKNHKPHL